MGVVKEKPIWKFNVVGRQETSTKSSATARGKTFTIDEPLQRGGTDEGPMPVEFVFMGLAGCTHVISNKLAKANGVKFTAMDIDIAVTMDSHGTRLINPIDVPFPEVILRHPGGVRWSARRCDGGGTKPSPSLRCFEDAAGVRNPGD